MWCQWRCSDVFIVNFENISHLLVSLVFSSISKIDFEHVLACWARIYKMGNTCSNLTTKTLGQHRLSRYLLMVKKGLGSFHKDFALPPRKAEKWPKVLHLVFLDTELFSKVNGDNSAWSNYILLVVKLLTLTSKFNGNIRWYLKCPILFISLLNIFRYCL